MPIKIEATTTSEGLYCSLYLMINKKPVYIISIVNYAVFKKNNKDILYIKIPKYVYKNLYLIVKNKETIKKEIYVKTIFNTYIKPIINAKYRVY